MWDKLVEISIRWKMAVVTAALLLLGVGLFTALRLPVDIFPDLTAPTVTVITEAHGMAPEEVEALITVPLETSINGATGVRRVRSASAAGISIVWVEFEWGRDIFIARQIVNEKLQLAQGSLPEQASPPVLAPISSIMGEIMIIGLSADTAKGKVTPMELRTLSEFIVRRRILSIPGVSQVVPIGGGVKQYQVLVSPDRLLTHGVTLHEVLEAARSANLNSSGGVVQQYGQEYLIRGLGRTQDEEEVRKSVVKLNGKVPVLLEDVARIEVGAAPALGDGSVNGRPGVVLVIQKQPNANTLDLTKRVKSALGALQKEMPEGAVIHDDLFEQADFIRVAIRNVLHAIRDGSFVVILVLFLFLWSLRSTFIATMAIPLSIALTVLVIQLFGVSINTMSLGGITIALGSLVDNAIVLIENIHRRLRENMARPESQRIPESRVMLGAFQEVSGSLFSATFIDCIVFAPLFWLSGVEGRMLIPLGIAYIVGILASLVVSVTATPALCALLFTSTRRKLMDHESWVVRRLKSGYRGSLNRALGQPMVIIGAAVALVIASLLVLGSLGRSFLPDFNEGTLTIGIVSVPGTNLEESRKIGDMVDGILFSFPEVVSSARRTGRAELDEHAQGANAAETEVRLRMGDRSKEEFLDALRQKLTLVPGTNVTIGQPISHRIDHMLSGTRANIALKIFGPNLYQLRSLGQAVKGAVQGVEGLVDLSVEEQVDVPQLRIKANRVEMAKYGVTARDLTEFVDVAFNGETATQIMEGDRSFDLVVRLEEASRGKIEDIREAAVMTPAGIRVPLSALATITLDKGPNMVTRENVQRKIVVSGNAAGRDVQSIVDDIDHLIKEKVKLPEGYHIQYGGQFESAERATRLISLLSMVGIALILLLLYMQFRSLPLAALVLVNLPLSLIGGVFILFLTGEILSVASIIGFITLFGIATRNGILLVSRYRQLEEAGNFKHLDVVREGSVERLSPILMTALATAVALLPLALARGETGNEIQSPLALVIIGGLFSSTLLNLYVIPVLYLKFFANREARLKGPVL